MTFNRNFDIGLISRQIFHNTEIVIRPNHNLIALIIDIGHGDGAGLEVHLFLDEGDKFFIEHLFVVEFDVGVVLQDEFHGLIDLIIIVRSDLVINLYL